VIWWRRSKLNWKLLITLKNKNIMKKFFEKQAEGQFGNKSTVENQLMNPRIKKLVKIINILKISFIIFFGSVFSIVIIFDDNLIGGIVIAVFVLVPIILHLAKVKIKAGKFTKCLLIAHSIGCWIFAIAGFVRGIDLIGDNLPYEMAQNFYAVVFACCVFMIAIYAGFEEIAKAMLKLEK